MDINDLIAIIYFAFPFIILYNTFKFNSLNNKYRSLKSKRYNSDLSKVIDEDLFEVMKSREIESEKTQSQIKKSEDDLIIINIKLNNLQNNVDALNREVYKNTKKIDTMARQRNKEKYKYDKRIKINEENLRNKKNIMDFSKDNLIKSLIIVLNNAIIKDNIEKLYRKKEVLSREYIYLNNTMKELDEKYNKASTFTPIDYKPGRENIKDMVLLTNYSFRLEQNYTSYHNISKLVPYIKRSIKLYDGLTTVDFLENASTLEKNYEINYESNNQVYIKEERNKAYIIHTIFGDIGTIPKDTFLLIKRFLTHDFLITWSLEGGKYRFIDNHPYTEKEFINTSSSSYEIHIKIDFYR